ncbi:NAD-dependent epimerase/dehydratase family protein [Lederbergia galactosidilytica]|uniref:NAD-dependent dehydratase n=1 Tax=Lederbergia galactosidilytica TaxID=217031 RepID=A0A0Q9Y7W6_9BACI|nr:GDP-mannose 4,6-dehydratase [Lederbergia galactosidilytica]KRG16955.1 NAD-dependent dehydratase [Lederbergia galactosidilytica]OAK74345.1 NAD-dependent dehydratase [Lederbergia galactosidilytica]
MKVLVTGGTGFIGRWVTKKLLEDEHDVWIVDNLANSRTNNIEAFNDFDHFKGFTEGDIKEPQTLKALFKKGEFDICYHLAASINVQDSIDDPKTTFENDTIATFHLLELCKKYHTKLVFMSTCMVYDQASNEKGITELDPIKPASPYAGAKIAAENMVLSYYYAYDLPVVVVRPFNTYGPFQKTGGEGGVVAIFIHNRLDGKILKIYGDGTQTRDLLYVEDCADFVVSAGYSDQANGEIINAGTGRDIAINDLALLIAKDPGKIQHVEHIHPQSEIPKLLCNYEKAKNLLNWKPKVSLEEGIQRTEQWIKSQKDSI